MNCEGPRRPDPEIASLEGLESGFLLPFPVVIGQKNKTVNLFRVQQHKPQNYFFNKMIEVVYGFEDILMAVYGMGYYMGTNGLRLSRRLLVVRCRSPSCTTAAKKGREIGTTEPARTADFFTR